MRLTLRTLLAHLDKTLDAADDAAIVAKLRKANSLKIWWLEFSNA